MTEKEDINCFDNVTDEEKEISRNALVEFKRKNFNACLQHLHKLNHRSNDVKVSLNKAVVEFSKSDYKKVEQFSTALSGIFNNFHISLDKMEDVNQCVVYYNQVVLYFHKRHYTDALRIIDRICKFIETMDDSLAIQVYSLATELHLLMKMPEKAMSLVEYMEENILSKGLNISKQKDGNGKMQIDFIVDDLKKKLAKYKSRCYLMLRNLSAAMEEIKIFSSDKQNIDALFHTANVQYLAGNFDEAMKILSSIPADCLIYREVGESSNVLFYNNMGVIHHALGKPNLACRYFQLALSEDLNIQEALKKDTEDKPVYILGGSKFNELTYNLGIAMLHAGRYAQAFECLIISVRRYHKNSRLWLRIAECCINLHKPSNEIDFDPKRQKDIVSKILGVKEQKKFILASNLSVDKKYSVESQSYAVPVPSLEFASICLRNAYSLIPSDCKTTPTTIYRTNGNAPPVPTPEPGPAPSSTLNPDDIVKLRNSILAASAYVSLCLGDYIIALEDAKKLLAQPRLSPNHKLLGHMYAAESLILLNKLSEAMEHLNPENIQSLGFDIPPAMRDDTENTEQPYGIDHTKTKPPHTWYPSNIETAQTVLNYNMAVAKVIRGQLDQAAIILQNMWKQKKSDVKVPVHLILLVIYIELKLGHADIARQIIRQYVFQNKINYYT